MGFLTKLKSKSDSNLRKRAANAGSTPSPSSRPPRAAAPQHPPMPAPAPPAKDEWVLLSDTPLGALVQPPQTPLPPPRSSSRHSSTNRGYTTPSYSVQPGQIYASPPFYPQSPPTSEGGHASLEGGAEHLSVFGRQEGGDAGEQWRNVLGGAYRPPPSTGHGEENGVLRSPPKRRESLLGTGAGQEGTGE